MTETEIRRRRRALEIPQIRLARRAGVSQVTVSHLETGYVVSAELRQRVIDALCAMEAEARPADRVSA